MATGLLSQVVELLEHSGIDLVSLGLGWARAAPVVAIVPAFGLRALPGPVRAIFGLAMAAAIAPAVGADPTLASRGWVAAVLTAFAQGLPIAIAAAVPLWAATMAGGVVDAVRGSSETVSMAPIEGRPTPLGVPLALLASAIFLSTGGPARVASALAAPSRVPGELALMRAALDIASGVHIALAVAAPVLAASIVLEIGAALVARAASPAQIHALLAPMRSLGVLAVTALVLERVAGLIAVSVGR
jgi:type III secretory pathway component EscT